MDLSDVMVELAERLGVIDGLNVYDFPVGAVHSPAALLSYPERIEFHAAYQGGMAMITIPLVVVAGKAMDKSTRERLGHYCAGAGTSSIKAVLESGSYTAFDDVTVSSAEFDVVQIAGVDEMAALFSLDIGGSGT